MYTVISKDFAIHLNCRQVADRLGSLQVLDLLFFLLILYKRAVSKFPVSRVQDEEPFRGFEGACCHTHLDKSF